MKTLLMLGMVLVLTNCAHHGTANDTFDLAVGMDEHDVKHVMGEPRSAYKDSQENTMKYVYDIGNGFGFDHPYTCFFKEGRLVTMGYSQASGSNASHFNTFAATYPIYNPNTQPVSSQWLVPLPGYSR